MSIFTIAALMLATIPAASAQNQTTFRDANGQTTGTATTYGNTTTFRDGRGQTTGTATRETTALRRSATTSASKLGPPQRRAASSRPLTYLIDFRHPALMPSSSVQNQRSPLLSSMTVLS